MPLAIHSENADDAVAMHRAARNRLLILLSLFLLLAVLPAWHALQNAVRSARLQRLTSGAAAAEMRLPRRTVWAWERPEDLRALDVRSTGIAVLEEEISLSPELRISRRRSSLIMPDGAVRTAVVRLESSGSAGSLRDSRKLIDRLAAEMARVASRPGTAALQIDFDARKSERSFYADLLRTVRERMPAGMPLEMTALVSWCGRGSWLAGLPVNSAVPMFFRMEPDRRGDRLSSANPIAEPLCAATAGVSTREPWPAALGSRRLYIFADRGWAQDMFTAAPLLQPTALEETRP